MGEFVTRHERRERLVNKIHYLKIICNGVETFVRLSKSISSLSNCLLVQKKFNKPILSLSNCLLAQKKIKNVKGI